jgi:hypothetical protein
VTLGALAARVALGAPAARVSLGVLLAALAVAGCTRTQGKAEVTKTKPMIELVDVMQKAEADPSAGTSNSEPIPVREGGRVLIAVFHYATSYDPAHDRSVLSPPTQVWYFDPATGERVREEARPGGPPLGSEPLTVPHAEIEALLTEFYGATDTLLPAFARGDGKPAPEIKAAAGTYKRGFDRVSIKLHARYYQDLGQEWFRWVDAAAAD